MEAIFNKETKTGDIVTKFPGASTVLKKHRIDFCCGGNRPIGEVLQEKNLSLEILNTINEMYQNSQKTEVVNWDEYTYSELADLIVNKYHQPTRELLLELEEYVAKIYRVHGKKHPYLEEVHSIFLKLKSDMAAHTLDEEEGIFKYLKEFDENGSVDSLEKAKSAIKKLEDEHDEVGRMLENLRHLTEDYCAPAGACKTFQLAYIKLNDLENITFNHVHVENNILFPRVMNHK